MMAPAAPEFIWNLFQQLRRRRFPLGPSDYDALRQALQAGFGWSSPAALRDLCCALWAKSKPEQEIVTALFDQLNVADWELPKLEHPIDAMLPDSPPTVVETPPMLEPSFPPSIVPATVAHGGLPPITLDGVDLPNYHFIFVPQFPLTYREVAQAWRRLRHPIRQGPAVELDIEATLARRMRTGVAATMVLQPRRRNTVRLLLLIDRQGSMAPFHHFVDEICLAIQLAGNLQNVSLYYFHDTPVEGADEILLETLSDQLFPNLDTILAEIEPLTTGFVYTDAELLIPRPLNEVLFDHADGAAVVLLGDAGAARGHYDPVRLLDTVAFLKGLRRYTHRFIWLNPVEPGKWTNSTAAQLARHVPMFPLDRAGMYQAVNTLRGHPYQLERPL